MAVLVTEGYETFDCLAQECVMWIPELAGQELIGQNNFAVGVDHQHAAGSGFNNEPDFLLGIFPLGDIVNGAHHSDWPLGMALGGSSSSPEPAIFTRASPKTIFHIERDMVSEMVLQGFSGRLMILRVKQGFTISSLQMQIILDCGILR